jgi:hypothetical protein
MTRVSEDYNSTRAWLRDTVTGDNLILRGVSALEYLQLFVGYINEKNIEVYAKEKGEFDNIDYQIIDSFDNVEFTKHGNLLCCTLNQTINDMLTDYENTDELALIQSLSNFYYENNESFKGLYIKPENIKIFENIKSSVINYYSGG